MPPKGVVPFRSWCGRGASSCSCSHAPSRMGQAVHSKHMLWYSRTFLQCPSRQKQGRVKKYCANDAPSPSFLHMKDEGITLLRFSSYSFVRRCTTFYASAAASNMTPTHTISPSPPPIPSTDPEIKPRRRPPPPNILTSHSPDSALDP